MFNLGKLNLASQSLGMIKCHFLLKHSASKFRTALHKSLTVSSMYQRELETTNPFCVFGERGTSQEAHYLYPE